MSWFQASHSLLTPSFSINMYNVLTKWRKLVCYPEATACNRNTGEFVVWYFNMCVCVSFCRCSALRVVGCVWVRHCKFWAGLDIPRTTLLSATSGTVESCRSSRYFWTKISAVFYTLVRFHISHVLHILRFIEHSLICSNLSGLWSGFFFFSRLLVNDSGLRFTSYYLPRTKFLFFCNHLYDLYENVANFGCL